MILYNSTRNSDVKVKSSEAILSGIAPDGGLYVPDDLSELSLDYHEVISQDYRGMASMIFGKFFPDFGSDAINDIVERSYAGKFSRAEITPLADVGDAHVLELYHGPTSAFKDVALSALPNLMTEAARANDFSDEILILTATSGDTGSAALHGFSDVPGTGIIVFYPDGGVSETQRLQMVTESGSNTYACAIKGNFDDAQTGVKDIFSSIPRPREGVSLSSANSINIGRLVPQVVYYFAAYKDLLERGAIADGEKVSYVVPTGNFGDIMAGWFAGEMGLPVGKLVCASNQNDVLTEFLDTGHYDRRREFFRTNSPSMDILVSSNLERLLYFTCGDERVREYMRSLSESGEYTVTDGELAKIKEKFAGFSCGDERGAKAISDVFRKYSYLVDTHTSIAWATYEDCRAEGQEWAEGPVVVLATASPYKFSGSVLEALGNLPEEDDKSNMDMLSRLTGVSVPEPLAEIFDRPIMHTDVIEVPEMEEYVIDKISY